MPSKTVGTPRCAASSAANATSQAGNSTPTARQLGAKLHALTTLSKLSWQSHSCLVVLEVQVVQASFTYRPGILLLFFTTPFRRIPPLRP